MPSRRRPARPARLLPALLFAALLAMGCGGTDGTEPDSPPIPPEPVGGGAGPPPSVPDVDGELPCKVELQLAEDERAELEIRFGQPEDCLHRLDA